MRRAALSGTALLLSAAMLLGACSGGDKKPAASAPPPTSAAIPSPPPSVTNQSTDPYCVFLRSYNDRFSRVDLNVADPQVFRRTMQEAAAAAKEAESTAPAAIRSDIVTLNRAFDRLLSALQQINFDMTKATPAILQDLSAPEFLAAGQRVETYTREHCV